MCPSVIASAPTAQAGTEAEASSGQLRLLAPTVENRPRYVEDAAQFLRWQCGPQQS
jgi:hypothetical protein